jgi:hypothetical protein
MPTESPTDDIAKRIGSAVLAASVGEARTTGQDSRIRKKDVIDFDDSCAFARIAEFRRTATYSFMFVTKNEGKMCRARFHIGIWSEQLAFLY